MTLCPCGSGAAFDACCGPLLAGAAAPTAEALMRSRYVAFTVGNVGYLAATLATDIRAEFDQIEAESTAKNTKWQGLEIRDVVGGGAVDDTGTVEFVARFSLRGKPTAHHERSTFRREDGRWVCSGGQMDPKAPPRHVVKVGRNEPCPCGSGKKHKKCCGANAGA